MRNIKRLVSQCLFIFCMITCVVQFYSCGNGEDDPLEDGYVDPDKEVPDPAETVQISMRNSNNGKTVLDGGIYINNDNFAGGHFVSLGPVKGLGNITKIPTTGWAGQVSVVPGNGYVAYVGNEGNLYTFYRIYVVKNLIGESNGIIGAVVKYQTPFKGEDKEIKLESNSLVFPYTGGNQDVFFQDPGVTVFNVETDVPEWCYVTRTSTYDNKFLTNGIHVRVPEHSSYEATHGTITLTTLYGKKTIIDVTRAGAEPFISFGEPKEKNISAREQTTQTKISGNISFEDLTIESSASWCQVELENSTNTRNPDNPTQAMDEQTRNSKSNDNNITSYNVMFTCEDNASSQPREAIISVRSKDGKAADTFTVKQDAAKITLEEELEVTANEHTTQIYFSSDVNASNLTVTSSETWCSATFKSSNYIELSIDENPTEDTRTAVISLNGKDGNAIATMKIEQAGTTFSIQTDKIGFDKNSNYRTIRINSTFENWEAESSADWCTFSKYGNQLTIRTTASNTDRTAVISFKGFSATITVHQSKYAVGEVFNENGIEGIVGYIGDEYRLIYKDLEQAVAWSTENIETGAQDSSDGAYNMEIIKKIPYWQNNYPAFALCNQLNTQGIDGWYLPARNELKAISHLLVNKSCWSSTEYTSSNAYYYASNNITYNSKKMTYNIVAVRKF